MGTNCLRMRLEGWLGYNPVGRNIGTTQVELTEAAASDPLLQGFDSPLSVHVSHSQRVLQLPAEATLLGACERDSFHAFRIGRCAWGVQFHPEFSADIVRDYIRFRAETIQAEGLDPSALLAEVRESSDGQRVLQRFRSLLG